MFSFSLLGNDYWIIIFYVCAFNCRDGINRWQTIDSSVWYLSFKWDSKEDFMALLQKQNVAQLLISSIQLLMSSSQNT